MTFELFAEADVRSADAPLLLRPYQEAAVDSIYQYFAEHCGNCLLVLPTGSGKSVIQAAFIRDALEKYPDERVLLVSHVRELLEQNADKIRRVWPDAPIGIYSAGLKSRDTDEAITVAGIQSCYERAAEFGSISLVIIDECHLVPRRGAGMYRRFLQELEDINPKLKIIGMSATPYRLDSGLLHEGDGAIFTDVAFEAPVRELVDDGYLCPLVSKLGATRADLSDVRVRGGEYVAKELEETMDKQDLVSAAVDEVLELCADRGKWLVFCCGVEHAHHVEAELIRRGISTACVTGKTPNDERDTILDDFRGGTLRAVTNVNVLTTGFDAPDIDAIILLRPTLSTGLYCQMIGRGMRPHESKTNTLVLDFAGNILRHGPIDKIRVRSRAQGGGVETAPMRECPECQALIPISVRVCAECGYEFEPKPREPKHDTRAAELDVMSDGSSSTEIVEVDRVTYRLHRKAGKPPSLRVVYHQGISSYSEWVCLEHPGYPRQKAEAWWRRRANGTGPEVPETVSDALALTPTLYEPRRIAVDLSGPYPNIVGHHDLSPPKPPPAHPVPPNDPGDSFESRMAWPWEEKT